MKFAWKKFKKFFFGATSKPVLTSPILILTATPPPPPSPPPPRVLQSNSSSAPQSTTSKGPRYPWSTQYLHLCPPLSPPGPGSTGVPQLTLPSFSPFPRYGFSSPQNATPSEDIYLFGGLVADKEQNDLYKISISDNSSTLIQASGHLPSPRVGHACVLRNHVLVVWGGDTNVDQLPSHQYDNALYMFNLLTQEWTMVKTSGLAPVGRYGHTMVLLGTTLILFGGQSNADFFNDIWAFELNTLKSKPAWDWRLEPATQDRPAPRTSHTCVAYGDDQLIVFGGTDGKFYYNDTWSFNLQTRVWTELRCTGYIPAPRESHAAAIVNDIMYIFGGRGLDGRDLGDLVALKISTRRWYMFQNTGLAPSSRSGHAMATIKSNIYLFGGDSFTKPVLDDSSPIHILDTELLKYPDRGIISTESEHVSVS